MPETPSIAKRGLTLWQRAALALLAGGVGISGPGVPHFAFAQVASQAISVADDDSPLSQPQLEQLLAPIALFPDDLLMQMLMASTYPIEIVQAERWLRQSQNAQLQGEALATALQAQLWDPSVKSLLPFPDVLGKMNEELAWTQQLGDAVLGQQADVLNTIQVLRWPAQAAGQLQSGPQQTITIVQAEPAPQATTVVVVQAPPQVITIAPTNPTVVYVPVYDPNVVFGTWPHTSYPPTYFPPPPGQAIATALLTGMAFAAGAAIIGSLWGVGSPSWGRGSVNVNVNRYNNINVNRTQINNNNWRHDTTHRGGTAYRNTEVNNRYRGAYAPGNRADSREQFRGRIEQAERSGGGIGAAARDPVRPNAPAQRPGERPDLGAQRPGGGDRANLGAQPRSAPPNRPATRPAAPPTAPQRAPAALRDQGQGRDVRAAAERGAASRQAQPRQAQPRQAQPREAPARPQGGGARGGGEGQRGGRG